MLLTIYTPTGNKQNDNLPNTDHSQTVALTQHTLTQQQTQ